MKIQDLDIKSIKAYSKNPRKNDAAVDAAAGRIGVTQRTANIARRDKNDNLEKQRC